MVKRVVLQERKQYQRRTVYQLAGSQEYQKKLHYVFLRHNKSNLHFTLSGSEMERSANFFSLLMPVQNAALGPSLILKDVWGITAFSQEYR